MNYQKHPYNNQAEVNSVTSLLGANPTWSIRETQDHNDGKWVLIGEPIEWEMKDMLMAIVLEIVDDLNRIRANAAMPTITYAQVRDAIKARMGL